MCRIRYRRMARIGSAVVAGFLLMNGPVTGQDVTEPALKAAFIYNFAKFTEWPAALAQEPFVLCVVGDTAVREALARAVQDRVLGGQQLRVSFVAPGDAPPKCRLLYISSVTTRQAATLLAGVRDMPVLTMSDLDGFTDLGGIARLFFESGRMRFVVNVASADRAHLHISGRLLILGK